MICDAIVSRCERGCPHIEVIIFVYLFDDIGPELQCLLEVKEDLSEVLIFQQTLLDAK